MAQPTAVDLFGTGSSISGGELTIPITGLADVGLSGTEPVEVLAAIIAKASAWLAANTDEAVMATAELSSFAPVTRNETERTQYNFNFSLFGGYTATPFDPDDLVS